MARRRRPVAEQAAIGEGVPPELLNVSDPAWSSIESARRWFEERGWDQRGHLQSWFEPRHCQYQAIRRWALEQGWRDDKGVIDWERLASVGVIPTSLKLEELVFPPGVSIEP